MNILVIGGGGREHALCWKLRKSAKVDRLFCAPGNAGTVAVAECVMLVPGHAAVIDFALANGISLVVIGPEQPHALPVVIKADGLAAGKGVVIATTAAEAHAALDGMPGPVVIEAFLTGPEASLFVLCDGTDLLSLGSAQDYKRVGDGDTGPNTGGMGAVAPAPALTPELEARALTEIVGPTVAAMAAMGTPFTGVLFAGLMLTPTGPQLIEYNVRFGDPECEVLMLRLDSDLLDLLLATCDGTLAAVRPAWRDDTAVTVVMAAENYPDLPVTGTVIAGIDAAAASGAIVFHAGTARRDDGALIASGGRVLAVTATGSDVGEARAAAYAGVDKIDWPGGFCRRDIGRQSGE
jgi:phosphoribosylamine--glycine ligase